MRGRRMAHVLAVLPWVAVSAGAGGGGRPARCEEGRVLVVGAGLAGLGAADALRRHGCDVTVLEAGLLPGGRAATLEEGSFAGMDIGAHWVHGGESNAVMAALLAYTGVEAITVGGAWNLEGGEAHLQLHNASGNALTKEQRTATLSTLAAAQAKFMGADYSQNEDVSYKHAAQAASVSGTDKLAWEWQQAVAVEAGVGADEALLSMRSFQPYARRWPADTKDQVVRGGYGAITAPLAHGLDVRYGTPVLKVKHGMEGVEVSTATGTVRGSVVIVTVPLHALQTARVEFEPALPDSKVRAIHGLAMATQIRVMLRFATRFWPEGKYCLGYTSEQRGEWPQYFSASFEEASADSDTLFAIISGEYALALSGVGDSAVVAAAVKILRRMYPAVGNPTASAVHYWGEHTPFIGGAKTYIPVDGDTRHLTELALPLSNNRLLFAGEATCAASYGTTHGAYASGLREAARVVGDTASWGMFREGLHRHCEEGSAPSPSPARPTGPSGDHPSSPPGEREALIPWYSMVGSLSALMLVVGFFLYTEAQSYFKQYGYPAVLRRLGFTAEADARGLRTVLLDGDADAEMVNLGTLMGDDSGDEDGVVYSQRGRAPPRGLPDFGDDEFTSVTRGRVRYPI